MSHDQAFKRFKEELEDLDPGIGSKDVQESWSRVFGAAPADPEQMSGTRAKQLGLGMLNIHGALAELATGMLLLQAISSAIATYGLNLRIFRGVDELNSEGVEFERLRELVAHVIPDTAARLGIPVDWAQTYVDHVLDGADAPEPATMFAPLTYRRDKHPVRALERLTIRVDPAVVTPDQLLAFYRDERRRVAKVDKQRGMAPPTTRDLHITSLYLANPHETLKALCSMAPPPRPYRGKPTSPNSRYANFRAELPRAMKRSTAWCTGTPAPANLQRQLAANRRRGLTGREQIRLIAEEYRARSAKPATDSYAD